MAIAETSLTASVSGPMRGRARLPAATLATHLAFILASVTAGRSTLSGVNAREDVLGTVAALQKLGARIEAAGEGVWQVDGVGLGGFEEPTVALDIGRAGIGGALLLAVVATQQITAVFVGGGRLNDRSWHWLSSALEQTGAGFIGRAGMVVPLTVVGAANPLPTDYRAADVLSRAVFMLAALNCPGKTAVADDFLGDEHTDAVFAAFGAQLERDAARRTLVLGQRELWPTKLPLPGDLANGMLFGVAALSRPGSDVVLERVPFDASLLIIVGLLKSMEADVTLDMPTESDAGRVVDVRFRAGALQGAVFSCDDGDYIDYYPALAIAACHAAGRTILAGWQHRSEWLVPFAQGLRACGIDATVEAATLVIVGNAGRPVPGGCIIDGALDYRVAAAFLILGLSADAPITVQDATGIVDHLPEFIGSLARLGAASIMPTA